MISPKAESMQKLNSLCEFKLRKHVLEYRFLGITEGWKSKLQNDLFVLDRFYIFCIKTAILESAVVKRWRHLSNKYRRTLFAIGLLVHQVGDRWRDLWQHAM